jgi:hypothetical protein
MIGWLSEAKYKSPENRNGLGNIVLKEKYLGMLRGVLAPRSVHERNVTPPPFYPQ